MAFTSEQVFAIHPTLFQPYLSFCLFSVFMQTGYIVGLMLKISGDDICLKYMQATMIVDRSSHGSRNMFDHYRDMRLDIDNMSYEVITISSILLLSFGFSQLLLTSNYWLWAGTTCSRRKDRECEHWLVWECDFEVFNGDNIFFFKTYPGGGKVCYLPCKHSTTSLWLGVACIWHVDSKSMAAHYNIEFLYWWISHN